MSPKLVRGLGQLPDIQSVRTGLENNNQGKGVLSLKQTVTIEDARDIMGKNYFFGPDEWIRFFGKKIQFTSVPEIPWSAEVLRKPGINQNHFLFLGLDQLDNQPLNLLMWRAFYTRPMNPKFADEDWYVARDFAKEPLEFRWYLMPIGPVVGSENLMYSQQVSLITDAYEVPSTIARVSANILYQLLTEKYLDADAYARTKDLNTKGKNVMVIGLQGYNISIDSWHNFAYDCIGIAASRKYED
jgi:hypothetical protein